tara:strand:+ start:381 stop:1271 length:891 start_codon:yes stop_codon:yes gene_type:complete
MKKMYEKLYLFSKFSVSFILLICLIGLLYVFLINYQNETKLSQNYSLIQNNLKNDVNKNLNLIKNLSEELKLTRSTISEIQNLLKSSDDKKIKNDILKISENINILNNNFNLLSKEIENFRNNNNLTNKNNNDQPSIIYEGRNEVIDLILIKYENNINFDQELQYLKTICNEKKLPIFEKISLLKQDPFKGFKNLKNIFNSETNLFLKENIIKKEDSLISKFLLPYLNISPSSENTITNNEILALSKISKNLDNKNIRKALDNFQVINNYKINFTQSLEEINKYLKFVNELYLVKQ